MPPGKGNTECRPLRKPESKIRSTTLSSILAYLPPFPVQAHLGPGQRSTSNSRSGFFKRQCRLRCWHPDSATASVLSYAGNPEMVLQARQTVATSHESDPCRGKSELFRRVFFEQFPAFPDRVCGLRGDFRLQDNQPSCLEIGVIVLPDGHFVFLNPRRCKDPG